jgi:uncharacterized Zn finger protein (UPF0148 family)
MGQDTIYSIECGTANPLNAETCSQCQAELMPPHPIQLDGGGIYTLKCEKCQTRVVIEDIDGHVRCSNCDTYHKIDKGDGYLTIHAVLKMKPKDAEAVLAAEDCKPMLLSTLDERLNEMRKATQNRDMLVRKLNEVDSKIGHLNKKIAKARQNRSFGIVLIPVGIIGFVAINSMIDAGAYVDIGMAGFIDMLSILCLIIGILLVIFSYSGKKNRKLEGDLAGSSAEAVKIHQELDNMQKMAGGR